MSALPPTDPLDKLVAWGNAHLSIRAMLLTSSRARPNGPVDILSDYDVILVVTDAERFGRDDVWLSDYGEPMVRWGDQDELHSLTTYFRGVLYEDQVKIDYTVWPVPLLKRIVAEHELLDEFDAGYRVLLDKDQLTSELPPPSYRAYIPARPTAAEYQALIEEFWWDTTYAAKSLWRDELVFAKRCLDYKMKIEVMRRMLEWRVEIAHDWSVRPGVFGRGLQQHLPADIWSALKSTYVGPAIENNWDALFRATMLFRRVAQEVGAALGYTYPQRLDDRVSAYLDAIRQLPPAVKQTQAEITDS